MRHFYKGNNFRSLVAARCVFVFCFCLHVFLFFVLLLYLMDPVKHRDYRVVKERACYFAFLWLDWLQSPVTKYFSL